MGHKCGTFTWGGCNMGRANKNHPVSINYLVTTSSGVGHTKQNRTKKDFAELLKEMGTKWIIKGDLCSLFRVGFTMCKNYSCNEIVQSLKSRLKCHEMKT